MPYDQVIPKIEKKYNLETSLKPQDNKINKKIIQKRKTKSL